LGWVGKKRKKSDSRGEKKKKSALEQDSSERGKRGNLNERPVVGVERHKSP